MHKNALFLFKYCKNRPALALLAGFTPSLPMPPAAGRSARIISK